MTASTPAASPVTSFRSSERAARKGGASLPRIPALDGLRAIAVIAVVVGHSFATTGSTRAGLIDHSVNIAVRVIVPWAIDLFFVISGYLITAILYETRTAERPLLTFYSRRLLRIVPLYYLYLVLSHAIFVNPAPGAFGNEGSKWEFLFLTNFMMLKGRDAVGYVNAHFWTLAIEEQFYLLWPIVVLFAPLRRLRTICIVLIIGSFLGRTYLTLNGNPAYGWLMTPTRLDGLIAGGLVAIVERQNVDMLMKYARRWFRISAVFLVTPLLLVIAIGVWNVPGPLLNSFVNAVTGRKIEIIYVPIVAAVFFATATALLARNNSGAEPVLTNPRLLKIAEASYGMYVFHIPILIFMQGWHITTAFAGLNLINELFVSALTVFLSYHVGHFTWIKYEKWFVKRAATYRYPVPVP
jgi:peptidoglycan/LPS O-acetylase OafA/YrhL